MSDGGRGRALGFFLPPISEKISFLILFCLIFWSAGGGGAPVDPRLGNRANHLQSTQSAPGWGGGVSKWWVQEALTFHSINKRRRFVVPFSAHNLCLNSVSPSRAKRGRFGRFIKSLEKEDDSMYRSRELNLCLNSVPPLPREALTFH